MIPVFLTSATGDVAVNPTMSMLPMLAVMAVFFVIVYFLMIRPQKKRDKELANMRNTLEVGDTVTTIGGIIGIVASVKDDTVVIETGGERTKVRFKRSAIAEVEKLNIEEPAEKSKS